MQRVPVTFCWDPVWDLAPCSVKEVVAVFCRCAALLVLLIGVATNVCAAPDIPGLREVRRGREPKPIGDPPELVSDSRGWHFACVVKTADGMRVNHDGVLVGPAYPEIWGLTLSPDGRRVAYACKSGKKWRVVVDGEPGPEYDGIPYYRLIFSPDSQRVAYACQTGKKWRVVVDGEPGPEYDYVHSLTFSPDSRRVAYVAHRGKKRLVVVDGEPGPQYDSIIPGGPSFRPDGTIEWLALKDGGLWRVTVPPLP